MIIIMWMKWIWNRNEPDERKQNKYENDNSENVWKLWIRVWSLEMRMNCNCSIAQGEVVQFEEQHWNVANIQISSEATETKQREIPLRIRFVRNRKSYESVRFCVLKSDNIERKRKYKTFNAHRSPLTVDCSTTSEKNCIKLKNLNSICIEALLLLLLLNWNLSESNVKVLCRSHWNVLLYFKSTEVRYIFESANKTKTRKCC